MTAHGVPCCDDNSLSEPRFVEKELKMNLYTCHFGHACCYTVICCGMRQLEGQTTDRSMLRMFHFAEKSDA